MVQFGFKFWLAMTGTVAAILAIMWKVPLNLLAGPSIQPPKLSCMLALGLPVDEQQGPPAPATGMPRHSAPPRPALTNS